VFRENTVGKLEEQVKYSKGGLGGVHSKMAAGPGGRYVLAQCRFSVALHRQCMGKSGEEKEYN
jgi:hypothetical protein